MTEKLHRRPPSETLELEESLLSGALAVLIVALF